MSNAIRWLVVAIVAAAVAGCGGTGDCPTPGSPGAAGEATDAVARIGDHAITLEDVDLKAKEIDIKPFQALYDARKAALDTLVSDYLLETEAASRGITPEALVDQEVNRKVEAPTAEQIQSFYDQNQKAMRGRTLEQVSAQISNFLANQGRQQAMSELLAGIRETNPVKTSLEPPRTPVTVADNDPMMGVAGAPVLLVAFSDFQ
jgi:hypothetical protein